MSIEQDPPQDESNTFALGLDPNSYTARRLQHSTPEHLHLTTRCCFIGPIPEGWLKSHRKQWYQHHLHINYYTRAATFSAKNTISRLRQLSGLEGPSVSAIYSHSFPQPDDVDDDDDDGDEEEEEDKTDDGDDVIIEEDEREEEPATTEIPPAIPIPRSTEGNLDNLQVRDDEHVVDHEDDAGRVARPIATNSSLKRKPSEMSKGGSSFYTARESFGGGDGQSDSVPKPRLEAVMELGEVRYGSVSSDVSALAPHSTSQSSLLPRGQQDGGKQGTNSQSNDDGKKSSSRPGIEDEQSTTIDETVAQATRIPTGLVRFNIPEEVAKKNRRTKARLEQLNRRHALKQFRRSEKRDGEIVKMEKMLVKVESTIQKLPDEYDENESMAIDTKTVEKWQEFVLVCRESASEEADYILQLYKSRVIPANQKIDIRTHSTHEIILTRKTAKVNLYSTLDKTVVVWVPWKNQTMIYILRPRSLANSVEWYTFLRNALGWQRSREVQVHVPDLSVTLYLENPFEQLEAQRDAVQASNEIDDTAIIKTMQAEQAVAGNIINRCMEMLESNPEWAELFRQWSSAEKMGLAWKRYDRLEWVHGANEQKMYGTVGMQRSHDLELRPKQHYPTNIKLNGDSERRQSVTSQEHQPMTEPSPIEGFLIRLTSQRGRDRRMGRMFYKRLYFSTHDQFLCFSRPAYAIPPPPPRLPMTERSTIPSTRQIAENMPLIYAIVPFRLDDGEIAWLQSESSATRQMHDQDAFDEAERRVNTLLRADGFIDLCKVVQVRSVVRGAIPADRNIGQSDAVDFNEDVPNDTADDGTVESFDDGRTFELVLKNGLIVRLEAYDGLTKKEWITRLRDLVKYWKHRKATDMEILKSVRRTNLDKLRIDEEDEPYVGQFAEKWEVSQAIASAELYNMCGISCCRTVSMSGLLYWKPRRRTTFRKCNVILCHGQLLLFQSVLRTGIGKEIPSSHQERHSIIPLNDCYIYSGLITEDDLLHQNQFFDTAHPGRHALPRLYLEDGWTSADEDAMTTFVIWRSTRKSYFRSNEDQLDGSKRFRLRQVSRLGVPGRSIVLKARSRAERDNWVMSIATEIERLQQPEEFRVVSSQ
ncbi:MAG: hypothetical protein M1816_000677 [Peltula sp. TS41687]|nr:MAG: hypothetical protein M1816_000677 [Peltula sp. TS41687]